MSTARSWLGAQIETSVFDASSKSVKNAQLQSWTCPRSARQPRAIAPSAATTSTAASLLRRRFRRRAQRSGLRGRRTGLHLPDLELGSPVLLPAVGCVVVRDRYARPEALRREPVALDAVRDEVLHDRGRTRVRQALVEIVGARVVR